MNTDLLRYFWVVMRLFIRVQGAWAFSRGALSHLSISGKAPIGIVMDRDKGRIWRRAMVQRMIPWLLIC